VAPDRLYIASRRALLDALNALGGHRDSVVLIGAQAVYLHAPDDDLAVAPTTTDADLGLDPDLLADSPLLEELLRTAEFSLTDLAWRAPWRARQQGCAQSRGYRGLPGGQRGDDDPGAR
jgi:hypothetical protein